MTQAILLNPGPVNVDPAVKAAIAGEDWCHREPEMFVLQDRIRSGILEALSLASAKWTVALLSGSGTCAVEAMISSFVPRGATMVVVSNGVYGDRVSKMGRAHGVDVVEVLSDPSEAPDLARVEAAIVDARQAGRQVRALSAIHHETTTGLLNPIAAIGALAKKYDLAYLLDTVSGLGGEAVDLDAIGVAAAACTANKCFEGLPGVCFVLARRDALATVASDPPKTLYLHVPTYVAKQDARDTPFTPAVQVMMALDVAIAKLKEETLGKRIDRYKRYASIVRTDATRIGLKLWLPEALRSNTITSFALPASKTYEQLHDAMRAAGFVIYAGQGDLRTRAFRIANMGQIPDDELRRAMRVLAEVIA
ncbi:MAG: pyridoxal-phosphate-dependent aminotransferase family protein [Polyangiales bacterium]